MIIKTVMSLSRPSAKLRAIIFDIGGVVTYHVGGYIRQDIIKTLSISKVQYHQACRQLIPLLQTDQISEAEFWQQFAVLTKTSQTVPENLWGRTLTKRQRFRPQVVQIIKQLKKQGLIVASLSNTIKAHALVHEEKKLYQLFDFRFLSYEVKLRKPDPRIYQLALKKLNTLPEETIFIDNELENIVAAQKLGIKGIHFRNTRALKNKLRTFELFSNI